MPTRFQPEGGESRAHGESRALDGRECYPAQPL